MTKATTVILSIFLLLTGCSDGTREDSTSRILEELEFLSGKMDEASSRIASLEDDISDYRREFTAYVAQEAGFGPQNENVRPVRRQAIEVGHLPAYGDDSAEIAIVEFTDYQCPFCQRHFRSTYESLKSGYIEDGVVQYFVSDFPLRSHGEAKTAAVAAACAREQDRYWEFHDAVFSDDVGLSRDRFIDIATALQLDSSEFISCLDATRNVELVDQGIEMANNLDITGTPSFLIGRVSASGVLDNGVILRGYHSIDDFNDIVERFRFQGGR